MSCAQVSGRQIEAGVGLGIFVFEGKLEPGYGFGEAAAAGQFLAEDHLEVPFAWLDEAEGLFEVGVGRGGIRMAVQANEAGVSHGEVGSAGEGVEEHFFFLGRSIGFAHGIGHVDGGYVVGAGDRECVAEEYSGVAPKGEIGPGDGGAGEEEDRGGGGESHAAAGEEIGGGASEKEEETNGGDIGEAVSVGRDAEAETADDREQRDEEP